MDPAKSSPSFCLALRSLDVIPAPSLCATPCPSFPSSHAPFLTRCPPTPLHTIHQHPSHLSLTTHCSLLTLCVQWFQLSICTLTPQRTHCMLGGILSQGGCYAFLERHTRAARDAGWEVACNVGKEGGEIFGEGVNLHCWEENMNWKRVWTLES